MAIGDLILICGVLMAIAIGASLLAGRLRVPALVLFLAIGMVVGTDGLGLVHFDDYELAQSVGIVALALIIFEGGLSTRAEELRPVAGSVIGLSVVTTLLTAVIAGMVAIWLFDLDTLEGMLLGSIIASTDAAAVFAQLRGSTLRPRLARLLEGEAGSNDPIAILLVLGFIEWIMTPGYGPADMLVLLLQQSLLGIAVGLVVGIVGARALRAVNLPTPGLYPVTSLAVAAVAFGGADVLGGSGFLAVYLAGLVLGSTPIPARRTITAFHDGLAWVAQLSMFLTLGLLVFPSELVDVAPEGLALALVLAFVARPIASTVGTAFARLGLPERALIGWAGLRGAVPVVLATFPVIDGVPGSDEFFDIIFFAVVVSLLVQGPTIEPLAQRLGLTTSERPRGSPLVEISVIRDLGGEVIEYGIEPGDAAVGAAVRDLGLPREAVVNVIVRDGEAIPPRGSTRLRAGDRLHILVRREVADEVEELTKRWRTGPLGPLPRALGGRRGHKAVFTLLPGDERSITGDPERPTAVVGVPVVEVLRVRRDVPGALVALADRRYAVTGPLVMVGGADDLGRYLRRRVEHVDDEERAWLQGVIGAIAADFRVGGTGGVPGTGS